MPIIKSTRGKTAKGFLYAFSVLTIPKIVILGIVLTQKIEYPFTAHTNGFN